MTSTDLVLSGGLNLEVIAPLSDLAAQISKTDFVPQALRNKPEAVLACFLTGQEVGISPMQSLRQIDIIQGRPALRAELMRALILQAGHELWFGEGNEFTTTRVVCYGRRSGSSTVQAVTWTIEMAQAAKLTGKDNWRNYPRAQLAARASSEVARLVFPDVVAGMGYAREELEDNILDTEIVEDQQEPQREAKATTRKAAAPRKRAAAPQPAPAPAPQQPAAVVPLPGEEPLDVEVVEEDQNGFSVPSANDNPAAGRDEQTPEEKTRSGFVVRKAKALGVDHHHVLSALTRGAVESARRLTSEEATDALDAIQAIADGKKELVYEQDEQQQELGEFSWFLVDTTPVSNEDPAPKNEPALPLSEKEAVEKIEDVFFADEEQGGPERWDVTDWREYLKENQISVSKLIYQAAVVWKEEDREGTPPGSIASIKGSGIADKLAAWVAS